MAHKRTELDRLLDDVSAFVRRYFVVSDVQLDAIALWITHSYVVDIFDGTVYIAISSAEKQSGKTRLLELLALMVARPWGPVIGPSEAVLYRKVAADRPTLLLDEYDGIFNPKREALTEPVRAILNAGFRRGATVPRCVGEGSKRRVEDFPVFCAKALAGIGALPDTLHDRSVVITLKRRTRDERIERFREHRARMLAEPIRERLGVWAEDAVEALREAEPELPEELSDRGQDAWEPLLAIADAAGGGWPLRAREAAIALSGSAREDDGSLGVSLLADCRAVFDSTGAEQLPSQDLLDGLGAVEEAPWQELSYGRRGWVDGRSLTKHGLAAALRKFGIRPHDLWVDGRSLKGYGRGAFEEPWTRYLEGSARIGKREEKREAAIPLPEPDAEEPSRSRGYLEGKGNGGSDGCVPLVPGNPDFVGRVRAAFRAGHLTHAELVGRLGVQRLISQGALAGRFAEEPFA